MQPSCVRTTGQYRHAVVARGCAAMQTAVVFAVSRWRVHDQPVVDGVIEGLALGFGAGQQQALNGPRIAPQRRKLVTVGNTQPPGRKRLSSRRVRRGHDHGSGTATTTTEQRWGRSLPIGLTIAVEVEAGLVVSDLVVSACRPQHFHGAFLLGDGVVKLPGLCIGGGEGVPECRGVN